MQNVKRNKTASLLAIVIFVVLAFVAFAPRSNAQPSSINVQMTAPATTTVAYIGNGTATSTYQIDSYPTYSSSKVFSMAGIDSEYLYVQATASSTATVFTFTPQFSNNGIDWYNIASTSGTVATWNPGTTATSGLAFKLPDMQGLHERILTSATGAAGAVYEEVVLKKNASGQ